MSGRGRKQSACKNCPHAANKHRLEPGEFDTKLRRRRCDISGCLCQAYEPRFRP